MGDSAFFSLLPYYHYIFLINVLFCLEPFIPSCLLSAREASATQSYLRWLPISELLTVTSSDQLGDLCPSCGLQLPRSDFIDR